MIDCELVQYSNKWCMKQGSIFIPLKPQPHLSELRFNGSGWEVFLGYPHGHGVPKFNVFGEWKNEHVKEG